MLISTLSNVGNKYSKNNKASIELRLSMNVINITGSPNKKSVQMRRIIFLKIISWTIPTVRLLISPLSSDGKKYSKNYNARIEILFGRNVVTLRVELISRLSRWRRIFFKNNFLNDPTVRMLISLLSSVGKKYSKNNKVGLSYFLV